MDPEVNVTEDQKKIAFSNSEHVQIVIQLLRESAAHNPLVGKSEFETIVNAVTLDAQSDLITRFINNLDAIRKGSLFKKP